jgi:hypothetical protein
MPGCLLRRSFAVAVALVGVAVVVAACGNTSFSGVASLGSTTPSTSSPSAPAGNSGGPPSPAETKKLLDFVACMRAHGVPNYPEPLSSGGFSRSAMTAVDQSSPQYQVSLKACRSLAIASGVEHTPAQIAQHDQQLLAYAQCMRKHGVPDFPDPTNGGFTVSSGSALGRNSPQFQTADKVCIHLNP